MLLVIGDVVVVVAVAVVVVIVGGVGGVVVVGVGVGVCPARTLSSPIGRKPGRLRKKQQRAIIS